MTKERNNDRDGLFIGPTLCSFACQCSSTKTSDRGSPASSNRSTPGREPPDYHLHHQGGKRDGLYVILPQPRSTGYVPHAQYPLTQGSGKTAPGLAAVKAKE